MLRILVSVKMSETWVNDKGVVSGVICPGTEAIYIVRSFTAWSFALVDEEDDTEMVDPLTRAGSLGFFEQLARSKPIL